MLVSDKTMMSLSHEDRVLWLVYITMGNLYVMICQSQNRPSTLLIGFISIVHEQVEDSNNKNRDLKAKFFT